MTLRYHHRTIASASNSLISISATALIPPYLDTVGWEGVAVRRGWWRGEGSAADGEVGMVEGGVVLGGAASGFGGRWRDVETGGEGGRGR